MRIKEMTGRILMCILSLVMFSARGLSDNIFGNFAQGYTHSPEVRYNVVESQSNDTIPAYCLEFITIENTTEEAFVISFVDEITWSKLRETYPADSVPTKWNAFYRNPYIRSYWDSNTIRGDKPDNPPLWMFMKQLYPGESFTFLGVSTEYKEYRERLVLMALFDVARYLPYNPLMQGDGRIEGFSSDICWYDENIYIFFER